MVMMCEPLASCIDDLKSKTDYDEIIYLSPDGELLNQSICNQLSLKGNLLLICGHYKGIDERIRDIYVTREISIGQYVISGGELAAAGVAPAAAFVDGAGGPPAGLDASDPLCAALDARLGVLVASTPAAPAAGVAVGFRATTREVVTTAGRGSATAGSWVARATTVPNNRAVIATKTDRRSRCMRRR